MRTTHLEEQKRVSPVLLAHWNSETWAVVMEKAVETLLGNSARFA
jgi:hypothetical protein